MPNDTTTYAKTCYFGKNNIGAKVACFRYENYSKMTLIDLENTLRENIDPTFTLDEVADDLSIFVRFLNE